MGAAFKEYMNMARRSWLIWNKLVVRGGRMIRSPNGRWTLDVQGGGGSGPMLFSQISTSALTMLVKGGPVVLDKGWVQCADGSVSISGTVRAPHYVYAYGTKNPLTAAIAPDSTPDFPVYADNQWRRALMMVYVDAGTIVVPDYGLLWTGGLIDLTGSYA